MHLLETGQHVVIVDDVYGGTQRYFRRVAKPTYNIDFTFVDFNDAAALRAAFQPGRTKLVWLGACVIWRERTDMPLCVCMLE